MRRHKLVFKRVHGEAESVNTDIIEESVPKLAELCEQYDADCIYNMDETGLYYIHTPSRVVVNSGE